MNGVTVGRSVAADQSPAELAELRGYYCNAVERAASAVREKYQQELQALDGKLVDEGKIEEALAVKRELAALSGQLVILDGRYASGSRKKDVTETLREMVAENRLVVPCRRWSEAVVSTCPAGKQATTRCLAILTAAFTRNTLP
jgi:hypothetical protein